MRQYKKFLYISSKKKKKIVTSWCDCKLLSVTIVFLDGILYTEIPWRDTYFQKFTIFFVFPMVLLKPEIFRQKNLKVLKVEKPRPN